MHKIFSYSFRFSTTIDLIMHVAMNRVDPVVVHYLQMSLHAISLRKNVLNNLAMYEASLH